MMGKINYSTLGVWLLLLILAAGFWTMVAGLFSGNIDQISGGALTVVVCFVILCVIVFFRR